ncbi:pyridoxamine 5'-phosphate oxidase family protein [Patescibacteria group bacterium]|nr:pyridoxamine 5'-phosphate oxidase family protein [Patescibacteria group bacterium]
MQLITPEVKSLVESQPVAIATVMKQGTPNVIGVAFVKVVDDQLIVTDNFMNQTIEDVKHNSRVAVIVWDEGMVGYKFLGEATYFNSGKWVEFVKNMPENKDMPAKGALVIKIDKVIKSS